MNEDLFPVDIPQLDGLRLKALNLALDQLNALKCKYLVITPDRRQYGELQRVVPETDKPEKPKKTRIHSLGPYGQGKAYLDRYLGNLPVGEVAVIPHDGIRDRRQMLALVTGYLSQQHGKGPDGYKRKFIYESYPDRTEVFRISNSQGDTDGTANL